MSFNSLKNNRVAAQQKLIDELNKMSKGKGSSDDELFWKPTRDKSGNGYAIIRFLPAPAGEDWPFVQFWDHGFQGPGGWYIENSLTSIGQDDPVSEYNSVLWNSGVDANKEQARKQKRRLHYISLIYVVQDSGNPANNGKVFYFKYGKKIFDKLNDLMNPEFQDEKPTNPFDLWTGANFKLKVRMVEGYPNYDKSEFDDSAPLASDEEMEKIYESYQSMSLKKFIDPSRFKSYSELKAKLNRVLGLNNVASNAAATPVDKKAKVAKTVEDEEEDLPWNSSNNTTTDEDEDEFEFFKKLAKS